MEKVEKTQFNHPITSKQNAQYFPLVKKRQLALSFHKTSRPCLQIQTLGKFIQPNICLHTVKTQPPDHFNYMEVTIAHL